VISGSVEQAAERLRKAVPIMVKHGIPVTPLNYALWYTYVANEDPDLNQRIDKIVAAYGTIPLTRAEGLFREHISPTGDHEATLARMKNDLEKMVHGIGNDLHATISGTRSFNSLLDECNRDLRSPTLSSTSIDDVFGTVEKLLHGSTAMQENTTRLEHRLGSANQEIYRLRSELESLRRNTMHDELTCVYNRRAFDTELAQFIGNGKQVPAIHLGMLDIDHFKQFNDNFGHPVGDRVLRLVGNQLNAVARVGVSAYRYGGEEFALIFCGGTAEQAYELTETLRLSIERLVLKDSRNGERLASITASIGLASRQAGETATDLVGRTDQALYLAKNSGRNQVCQV
jgi:diguanylate cyclase